MPEAAQYPVRPVRKGRSIVFPPRTGHCLWCGLDLREVKDKRRTSFCSTKHSDLYVRHFDWQWGLQAFIFSRDKFTCVKCGFSQEKWYNMSYEKRRALIRKWGVKGYQSILECDHIIPIALGGDPFSHDNLQTLCQKCHKKKTKQDLSRVGLYKALFRELRKYFEIKAQQKQMERYWNKVFNEK